MKTKKKSAPECAEPSVQAAAASSRLHLQRIERRADDVWSD